MLQSLTALGPSVWIFAAFAMIALAVIILSGFFLYDRLGPVLASAVRDSALIAGVKEKLRQRRKSKRRSQEDDDDLDDATQSLLSMLSLASVVVDDHDEVVRANPAAYALGIVADDRVVDQKVIEAVRDVFTNGGRRTFDLTTHTPEQFMCDVRLSDNGETPGIDATRSVNTAAVGEDDSTQSVGTVSRAATRPNWLKVTVGCINNHLAVVLIDDISDIIRFSRIRDSFITNVSEQLLQPTQALERLADSMESAELSRERIARDAAQVRHSCIRLEHMVSDLLLLITVQDPVTPSSANVVNLMNQINQAKNQWSAQCAQAGLTLRIVGDDTLNVHGEADQIRTAISKLIDNAIGYGKKGSSVGVSVARSSDGKYALIRVIDQGCGIAKEEVSRVFERFYRGSNQNEHTVDGIGLGLAIVKHVALAHHGNITVWSAPKQGSTFTLSLPLAQ